MTIRINTIHFQAQREEPTFSNRLSHTIQKSFSVGFHVITLGSYYLTSKLTGKLIVPAQLFYPASETRKNIFFHKRHSSHEITEIKIKTTDGIILDGAYIKNKNANKNTPTIILMNGNAASYEGDFFDWLIDSTNFNFVVFNYRGVGFSQGSPRNANNLVLDGEAVYQFTKDHLQVNPKNIHFYGWSLGAGVAAQVKVNHPECTGHFVAERSFTSLAEIPRKNFPIILNWIGCAFIHFFFWNMDTENALTKMKGKSLVIFHSSDHIMENASLGYTNGSSQKIEMGKAKTRHRPSNHHSDPLSHYTTKGTYNSTRAIYQVFAFLEPK